MLAGGTTLQTEVSELCAAALPARFGGLQICGVLRGALGDGHVVCADRECPSHAEQTHLALAGGR